MCCLLGSSYIQINAICEMSYGHSKVFSAVSVFHIFNEICNPFKAHPVSYPFFNKASVTCIAHYSDYIGNLRFRQGVDVKRVVLFFSCATLNCGDVLQAIGDILLQPPDRVSNTSLIRALLMLEWFLRTDLFTLAAFSQIISMPLNCVLKSESRGPEVKVKAQKIRLILNKLHPRHC